MFEKLVRLWCHYNKIFNLNDREVLRAVGLPVIVENAEPELKEEFAVRATFIPSVYEQGVAHYLNERFQLGLTS